LIATSRFRECWSACPQRLRHAPRHLIGPPFSAGCHRHGATRATPGGGSLSRPQPRLLRSACRFGSQPVYNKARLVVSAPIAGNRVARLWVGPSTDGGECEIITVTAASFVTINPTTGAMRPVAAGTRDSGGYGCTVGSRRVPPTALTWTFSPVPVGNTHAALVHGHVGQTYNAVRVDVVWNGGKEKLRTVDGYFIGVVATIRNPGFHRLPYTVVAYNAQGHAVVHRRIPTSFLYSDWKGVESGLHHYRQSNGCSTNPKQLWVCKTR
jgi:hypothetical protein